MKKEDLLKENKKAWKLVEELEKENYMLQNAARNAMFELDKRQSKNKDLQISSLEKKNKLLRKIIVDRYGISADTLNKMIIEGLTNRGKENELL